VRSANMNIIVSATRTASNFLMNLLLDGEWISD
jgi:hypothetical protein